MTDCVEKLRRREDGSSSDDVTKMLCLYLMMLGYGGSMC